MGDKAETHPSPRFNSLNTLIGDEIIKNNLRFHAKFVLQLQRKTGKLHKLKFLPET